MLRCINLREVFLSWFTSTGLLQNYCFRRWHHINCGRAFFSGGINTFKWAPRWRLWHRGTEILLATLWSVYELLHILFSMKPRLLSKWFSDTKSEGRVFKEHQFSCSLVHICCTKKIRQNKGRQKKECFAVVNFFYLRQDKKNSCYKTMVNSLSR